MYVFCRCAPPESKFFSIRCSSNVHYKLTPGAIDRNVAAHPLTPNSFLVITMDDVSEVSNDRKVTPSNYNRASKPIQNRIGKPRLILNKLACLKRLYVWASLAALSFCVNDKNLKKLTPASLNVCEGNCGLHADTETSHFRKTVYPPKRKGIFAWCHRKTIFGLITYQSKERRIPLTVL